MKVLLKKLKWLGKVAIGLLLLSFVGKGHFMQPVFAENLSEELVARTGGEQRIDANHLFWTPVSEEDPLGSADDFNAILFDSFVDFHETGGRLRRADSIM